ncbi:MAG: Lar family restriction alleviation protein [Fretibacterium sp.]|nr:Lar family restriction alleviation protein [Fretibacterium sp.]
MTEKLKPCPFCGGEMIGVHEIEDNSWLVFCHHCGGMMRSLVAKDNAIERWNRRANDE